jgi:hypothetical protein
MHHLLKRSVSIAMAAAMLSSATFVVAAQDEEGPGRLVPQPEECLVEPRDQAEIDTILAGGQATAPLPAGLPVPLGTPADDETRAEVEALVREVLACLNAGDAPRGASLFSENGLRGFYGATVGTDASAEQASAGTPTPRDEEHWLNLRAVTDASVMEDGRVAAFVVVDDPLVRGPRAQTLLILFTDEGGQLLVDGVVGFSLIVPEGTPTP